MPAIPGDDSALRSEKYRPDFTHAEWQAPQGSGDGRRIEIAFVEGMIGMRDSADPDGPVLVFTPAEWDAFVGGVEDGEFDVDYLVKN